MSEVYEYIEGYEHDNSYADSLIFEVDPKTKTIAQLRDQVLIAGEVMSQYIAFNIPRYFDGIDLAEKTIEVLYISPENYSDVNKVINARCNDDTLAFGWIVPGEALTSPGTLAFSLEFAGDKYKLKTRTIELEIYDGMKTTDILPEPVEQEWYIQVQNRCENLLNEVDTLKESVQESMTRLEQGFEEVKKRGSDVKERLAAVITDKGIKTASEDSFDVIIENAREIQTGINMTQMLATTTTTSNCADIKTIVTHEPYTE